MQIIIRSRKMNLLFSYGEDDVEEDEQDLSDVSVTGGDFEVANAIPPLFGFAKPYYEEEDD